MSAESLLDHFAVLKGITERRARKEVVEALLQQTNLWDVRKHFSAANENWTAVTVKAVGNARTP